MKLVHLLTYTLASMLVVAPAFSEGTIAEDSIIHDMPLGKSIREFPPHRNTVTGTAFVCHKTNSEDPTGTVIQDTETIHVDLSKKDNPIVWDEGEYGHRERYSYNPLTHELIMPWRAKGTYHCEIPSTKKARKHR